MRRPLTHDRPAPTRAARRAPRGAAPSRPLLAALCAAALCAASLLGGRAALGQSPAGASTAGASTAGAHAGDVLPRRALFGAQLAPVPDSARARLGLAAGEGLVLLAVTPGTTADAAGLRPGDVLLAVGGAPVTSPQAGVAALRALPVGRQVTLAVAGAGGRRAVRATVRERPRERAPHFVTHYDHVAVGGTRYRVMVTQPLRDGRPLPGRHPTLFVIGGIGAYSLDGPLGGIEYGDVLSAVVARGWATVRVDKAGQGDSEGGPTPDAGFEPELAMYRAALASLPRYAFVDTGRVFLFGHSMGGVFGPLLMAERGPGAAGAPAAGLPRFRGLAVYGTIAKPWPEYLVEAVRRQTTLAGAPLPAVDRAVRDQASLSHYLIEEGLEPDAVRARRPDLAAALAEHYPDGRTFSGLALPFWRQLARRRLADAWAAVDADVLVLYGESDFVGARGDHELIAAVVNQAHPGRATYAAVPESDHNFRRHPTMLASLQARGPAPVNPAARDRLVAWLERAAAR
jgi:hypothetical protein